MLEKLEDEHAGGVYAVVKPSINVRVLLLQYRTSLTLYGLTEHVPSI